MNRIKNLQDLLPEESRLGPQQLQAYLRESLYGAGDNPVEAKVKSVLPGDADFADHPLYEPPNPYLHFGFARLKRAWDRGLVPESQLGLVEAALIMLADGQAFGGVPCITTEQTSPRYYAGDLRGDTDIFDPSGITGPVKFDATILHSDD